MESRGKRRYAIVIGARPNFIKVAPFLKRAKNYPNLEFVLIHTGQHFDKNMSKIFFDDMQIPKPDIMLDIRGELHTEKIGKMFNALNRLFSDREFDGVIVFGDINSTLAAGIAAAKQTHKLIHIESGLRSHDRRMPEEINRAIVDHLSDLLFTTEPSGRENLMREGISGDKIRYVGNIMIESIEIHLDKIKSSDILDKLGLKPSEYIVATLHRWENTDVPHILEKLLVLLKELNRSIRVVFPMHPGTRKLVESFGLADYLKDIYIIEPLGYFEFMKLVLESGGVVTDSGGIQEETTHLGIPCATLRDNTERPITVEFGSNKLFPINMIDNQTPNEVTAHFSRDDFKSGHIPLWDSEVSKRILDEL